ncbi:MAG: serine hydrolase domain-containing protein [Saprospiraceae bacterium]
MALAHDAMSQAAVLRSQIGKILKYDIPVDFNVVPGILIGVDDRDSSYRFVFGKDMHEDGIYEMGSVTKPVIAWLIAKALDSLQLDKKASVCTFLPDSICNASWQKLTIDEIITHRSGLFRMPPKIGLSESDVRDPYKDYSIEKFAHDLQSIQPVPGVYSYSNIGYAMTYWLFEKVGGLEAFTKKVLTGPNTMLDVDWESNSVHIAPGYGMDGRPQPPWNTNTFMPAIGLKSSLQDLMRFVKIYMDFYSNEAGENEKALKKEIKYLNKSHAFKVIDGWFVIQQGNSLLYYHTGRTGGHQVSVAFIPSMKKSVVVISNGALGSNDLSLLILRMLRKSHPVKKIR